ncbi:MAG: type I-C CRISPR-associated protein Cas8c/Csd1 [Leptospiraceae bacterium]|nr:type I-C CRISPR-associated protein Cas8c/Csd1 [Leptospiraceae bacterium]MCP5496092.1 type I-C CRISPR-associated protein Cas8c/Csd1 [Leptospiraceae bacterium]
MFRELVELAKKNQAKEQKKGKEIHNAITTERFKCHIIIDKLGNFKDIIPIEGKTDKAQKIIGNKSGKIRTLLDKPEETLGITLNPKGDNKLRKKHAWYLRNVRRLKVVAKTKPIINFYRKKEYTKAIQKINSLPIKKERDKYNGHIAFFSLEDNRYFHEYEEVINFIISEYEDKQKSKQTTNDTIIEEKKICSICGTSDTPISSQSFGKVSKSLFPTTANDSYLLSYNEDEFLSYGLDGNENSNICENCGQQSINALTWLLSPRGKKKTPNKKTGEIKEIDDYKNRKLLIDDYEAANAGNVIVFWTRNLEELPEIDSLEEPDDSVIRGLFESIETRLKRNTNINPNYFYSIFMTGGSRIIVRNWISISTFQLKENICKWFQDIETFDYYENRNGYVGLKSITRAILTPEELRKSLKRDKNSKVRDIVIRIQMVLWRASILNEELPIWILTKLMNRIQKDSYKLESKKHTSINDESEIKVNSENKLSFGFVFAKPRIALLKLIINRNLKEGDKQIMSKLDESNEDFAYNWGRIFAVMASIQYKAFEHDVNAGMLAKNFTNASKYPAQTIGRLSKTIRYYLSKIKRDSPGSNISLEDEYMSLFAEKINPKNLPSYLTTEDQAKFTVGFYHQRHKNISEATDAKKKRDEKRKTLTNNLFDKEGEQK